MASNRNLTVTIIPQRKIKKRMCSKLHPTLLNGSNLLLDNIQNSGSGYIDAGKLVKIFAMK